MSKSLSVLLAALVWLSTGWAATGSPGDDSSYGFPIEDSFKATVVGTPEADQKVFPPIPVKVDRLTVFPDRKAPDYLWYESQLRYSYAFQDKPAPLIFLIAGTGGSYNGQKNQAMGRAFYRAGFHVVSLSSPTLPNFIVSASKTGVPGHAVHDAEDLYNVMEIIWNKFKDDIKVTDFYVTGYSLGGFNDRVQPGWFQHRFCDLAGRAAQGVQLQESAADQSARQAVQLNFHARSHAGKHSRRTG